MTEQQTYRIAMIGDSSTVRGFSAGGIDPYSADNSVQALRFLEQLIDQQEHAIIFITETLAESIIDNITRIKNGPVPAVIIIPDQSKSKGIGYEKIRFAVERAIGIDLLGAHSK